MTDVGKVDDEVHPFFGVDTQEVVALRGLAAIVVEYLEGEVDKSILQEAITELGLVLIKRYQN